MRFFKSVTIFALLTAFVACSSHKTTVSTGDATVSSDDANKTTTITTKDGSETIGHGSAVQQRFVTWARLILAQCDCRS